MLINIYLIEAEINKQIILGERWKMQTTEHVVAFTEKNGRDIVGHTPLGVKNSVVLFK